MFPTVGIGVRVFGRCLIGLSVYCLRRYFRRRTAGLKALGWYLIGLSVYCPCGDAPDGGRRDYGFWYRSERFAFYRRFRQADRRPGFLILSLSDTRRPPQTGGEQTDRTKKRKTPDRPFLRVCREFLLQNPVIIFFCFCCSCCVDLLYRASQDRRDRARAQGFHRLRCLLPPGCCTYHKGEAALYRYA